MLTLAPVDVVVIARGTVVVRTAGLAVMVTLATSTGMFLAVSPA